MLLTRAFSDLVNKACVLEVRPVIRSASRCDDWGRSCTTVAVRVLRLFHLADAAY